MKGKAIIFSAPSGAGKTTIAKEILHTFLDIEFSISACSRPKRDKETEGVDYYFLSAKEFKEKIDNGEFLEWQEVYPGSYYGTLKSEIQRIWDKGNHVMFDVDTVGGLNIKKFFNENALSIFIKPPSIKALEDRLKSRGTETPENIKKRMKRAEFEMSFADKFDKVILNANLEDAITETKKVISDFIKN